MESWIALAEMAVRHTPAVVFRNYCNAMEELELEYPESRSGMAICSKSDQATPGCVAKSALRVQRGAPG